MGELVQRLWAECGIGIEILYSGGERGWDYECLLFQGDEEGKVGVWMHGVGFRGRAGRFRLKLAEKPVPIVAVRYSGRAPAYSRSQELGCFLLYQSFSSLGESDQRPRDIHD